MKLADFDYDLPEECIARYPLEKRSDSRLMVLNRKEQNILHQHFYDLPSLLNPGDLLVFNDSRVIPARLFGKKPTGGQVEILVERILSANEVLALVKASHLKPGHRIFLDEQHFFEVLEHEHLYHLRLTGALSLAAVLEKFGHMPLPPYMNRQDEPQDQTRYQTIYARTEGSVAAPTAGLHFDDELMTKLKSRGIDCAFVTLHVGAGTFQPVKVENITAHQMHKEVIFLPEATVTAIHAAKARGNRVIAVGTTSARTLEAVAAKGELKAFFGETDIFIYPGFKFKVIDGLITNFHLPKSSLLMLVSAFASREMILKAYSIAIQHQYRFFSYGDAMLIV